VLEDGQFDELVDVVTHLEACPDISVLGRVLASSAPRIPAAE
jgi:hypothetical protein